MILDWRQLEDSEFARTAAVKGRQHAEQELAEAQQQLEEAMRLRGEAEDKYLSTNRERSNYQSQVCNGKSFFLFPFSTVIKMIILRAGSTGG